MKEFSFNYIFWSVDKDLSNFCSQEKVIIFTFTPLLFKSPNILVENKTCFKFLLKKYFSIYRTKSLQDITKTKQKTKTKNKQTNKQTNKQNPPWGTTRTKNIPFVMLLFKILKSLFTWMELLLKDKFILIILSPNLPTFDSYKFFWRYKKLLYIYSRYIE